MGSTSRSFSATKSSKHFDVPLAIDGSSQEPSNVDLQGAMFASCKGLNPWVIDVDAGQDVMSKILEFCEKVPDQAVWVISATGNLSEITFTLPFFDKITYEGEFEIISLSGSFDPINRGGRERKGGVSIKFARRDGYNEGGSIVGQLIVANFVRVIVGTFKTGFKKVTSEESQWEKEPTFVVENKKELKKGNDAGSSGVHVHESENETNPTSV